MGLYAVVYGNYLGHANAISLIQLLSRVTCLINGEGHLLILKQLTVDRKRNQSMQEGAQMTDE